MRITIIKLLPKIMLALGLASILLVSMPSQALSDEDVNYTDEQGNRVSQHFISVGNGNEMISTSETITSPGGSYTTKTWDNNGRINYIGWFDGKGDSKQTSYDPNGGMKTYSVDNRDGSDYTEILDPASCTSKNTMTGGSGCHVTQTIESNKDHDTTTTNYGAHGVESTITYDHNTEGTVRKFYTNGKMYYETDTDKNGMSLSRKYGADGSLQEVTTSDPKTGMKTDMTYNADGSTQNYQGKVGPDGKEVAVSQTTTKDGATHTDNYVPGCDAGARQNCKIASTVDDFGSDSQSKKTFDPTNGKLVSQTDTGPNNYQKTTTYDPKTGFMTSKSETQADGVHTVNYTGNCGQFGGDNCHETSEIVTDPKTNKVVSAKSCDNQGNCQNVDPSKLISVGGGPPVIPPAHSLKRQQIQGVATVTNNADGSTTSVTKSPDGSTTTETKAKDGASKVVTKNPDGSTSSTEFGKDGKTLGIQTFDNKGKQTSATAFGQDGNKTLTRTFGADGSTITTKFNPDGRPTSIDTIDPKGKLTSVSCDVPAVCAKALNQQAKQLKAGAGANALKADTKSKARQGANKKVQSDVLQQIGDKPSGDAKNAKDKLQAGDNKEKMKTGSKFMDEKLRSKSNNLQLGGTQQADVKSKGQDMTVGQKEKSSVMHNNRLPEHKVQQYTGGNKKVQNKPAQHSKEKKRNWGTSAGSSTPVAR